MLNFSIAYGKTPVGLARDWKVTLLDQPKIISGFSWFELNQVDPCACYHLCSQVSLEEAKETVDRWYSDRKEVLKWQKARKKEASEKGRVYTLLGRARQFPSMDKISYSQKGHIERAAINTPVQVRPFIVMLISFHSLSLSQILVAATG